MTTDITELALLVSKAKASVFTLEYISQFEPVDIDSDDVDLRFEVDGRDTGTNVSIVDECGQAARVISALVEALEKAQQQNKSDFEIKARLCKESNSLHDRLREAEKRIAELEDAEQKLCAANVTLDARAELAERQLAELESRTVTVKQYDEFQICHYGATEDYAKGYIDCQNNFSKWLTAAGINWEAK